ncbi:dihydrodipicolinate synthase family protein [Aquabacterium sp. J223]|uniref:dihydrodipicolinate synthase family protein n=1 Tax=Aquabacterium sp. J223 TaxID=2898431 RepID=UPI0021AD6C99|nr:dihydrodipicolinate synthase family protein [Aquabacterium sp. J223]UUX94621.1 dihydrodipicolinate synthase family protein [Aquabacterium sp. J223]
MSTGSPRARFEPQGVIPAVLLPFDAAHEVDEPAFRRHLADVTGTRGVTAIAVNGHSTEVSSCTPDERQRVLDIALDTVGDRTPVVAGVYSDSTREAAALARAAERSGAAALLVFAPNPFTGGAAARPEMTLAFYREIAAASSLPLVLFQFPMAGGLGTPLPTLLRLAEEVPTLRAVKDFTNHPVAAEAQWRALRALPRPLKVLTSHSSWLLGALAIGADGILSGAGSVIPELHVALFEAMRRGDLAAARAVNDRIHPLADAFYSEPFLDMHNRMKEALVMLGRADRAHVRGPLLKPDAQDLARLARALHAAGLLPPGH